MAPFNTVTTQDCRVNNSFSCLLTSCNREGNKSWSDLKTILWRVNSAQSVFTTGGNLYVLFPPGKIFLLCPHSVFTAHMEICMRTKILTSSSFLKPLKMLCFATTGTVLRQMSQSLIQDCQKSRNTSWQESWIRAE